MTLTVPESTLPTSTVPESPVVDLLLDGGMPGFPASERFALVEVAEAAPLLRLVSRDEDDLEFVVVPPAVFFPEYAPVIDDSAAQRLGLSHEQDALVLVVLTLGAQVADATANLMAPLVINRRDGRAAQVIAEGEHPLQAPLRR